MPRSKSITRKGWPVRFACRVRTRLTAQKHARQGFGVVIRRSMELLVIAVGDEILVASAKVTLNYCSPNLGLKER